jgi:hypothetical protein
MMLTAPGEPLKMISQSATPAIAGGCFIEAVDSFPRADFGQASIRKYYPSKSVVVFITMTYLGRARRPGAGTGMPMARVRGLRRQWPTRRDGGCVAGELNGAQNVDAPNNPLHSASTLR